MNDYPNNWNQLRKRIYSRDGYQCQNCGRRGGEFGEHELHAHHIVPLSQGGSNQKNNLVTLCKQCHDAAHGKDVAPTAHEEESEVGGVASQIMKVYSQYKYLRRALP